MSGGSAPSKSSAIQIFPFEHPGTLGSLAETSGTRRVRGFPALAMMISSPLAVRSTCSDSRVLASYRLRILCILVGLVD